MLEIIYAQGFLILDAGVASFRTSRSRVFFVSARSTEADAKVVTVSETRPCDKQHSCASMGVVIEYICHKESPVVLNR